jgi:hypothetical protein
MRRVNLRRALTGETTPAAGDIGQRDHPARAMVIRWMLGIERHQISTFSESQFNIAVFPKDAADSGSGIKLSI